MISHGKTEVVTFFNERAKGWSNKINPQNHEIAEHESKFDFVIIFNSIPHFDNLHSVFQNAFQRMKFYTI